jgi:hypothetical protein
MNSKRVSWLAFEERLVRAWIMHKACYAYMPPLETQVEPSKVRLP